MGNAGPGVPDLEGGAQLAGRVRRRWGGPLECVARSLLAGGTALGRGRADPASLRATLGALVTELGASGLAWLPDDGPAVGSPAGLGPKQVDWGLLDQLVPAQVHLVGRADRRRSPRRALAGAREFYVRTGPGVEPAGVLRVVSEGGLSLGRAALLALAEMVAGLDGVGRARERSAAERGERDLGRRVATVTHDLRNQLTLALLQVERLRLAADDDGALGGGGGSVGEVLDGLDGLESVLCAARDLCASTLGDGPAPAKKRLVLRAVLLEEARAATALSRRGQRVALRVRCPGDLRVHAELSALTRLVRNLVLNAVEASFDGGRVCVSARRASDGRVELSVEDVGRGMAADRVQAFLHAGRSGSGGTGYGTASLGECLGALDAECRWETALGAGTRVVVRLPGVPRIERPPVLLVDPDRGRRSRRAQVLDRLGLGTWEAADPTGALVLMRGVPLRAAVLARGLRGEGLAGFREECRRTGVPLWVIGAGEDPARILGAVLGH